MFCFILFIPPLKYECIRLFRTITHTYLKILEEKPLLNYDTDTKSVEDRFPRLHSFGLIMSSTSFWADLGLSRGSSTEKAVGVWETSLLMGL